MKVTTTALNPGQSLPLVIKPDAQSQQHTTAQFLEWVSGSRSWIVEHVAHHGGLLFRGFNLSDATQFEAFNDAMGFELMEYIRGNTPRSVVRNKVYTSTEVQRFVPIPLHKLFWLRRTSHDRARSRRTGNTAAVSTSWGFNHDGSWTRGNRLCRGPCIAS